MKTIDVKVATGRVLGKYDLKFQQVLEQFIDNFEIRHEIGASCNLTLEGKTVVDLWGGSLPRSNKPWEKDTVVTVFSATKGAMALCAHLLRDKGLLDFDQPVSKYWPEFAKNGKEDAVVRMALDHSLGLPHYRTPIPEGGFYDYEYMVKRTEDEHAFWSPGTRIGYHAISMAWTVGELVRRASGERLGEFFRKHLANQLSIDFWIGRDSKLESYKVSPVVQATADEHWLNSKFFKKAQAVEVSPTKLFMRDFGKIDVNSQVCHASEIGSANGITNARGLANLYKPFANVTSHACKKLISLEGATRIGGLFSGCLEDATLVMPTKFSEGFMVSMDNRSRADLINSSVIMGEHAYGHVGAGGSIGFADPGTTLSFGYAMNKLGSGLLLNERGQNLIDASYHSLGFSENHGYYA